MKTKAQIAMMLAGVETNLSGSRREYSELSQIACSDTPGQYLFAHITRLEGWVEALHWIDTEAKITAMKASKKGRSKK